MADLSLKIRANFDEAQAAFQKLQKEADDAGQSLSEFIKQFPEKQADNFIAKQKQAGAAIMITRGEVEAITEQKKAYQREIVRLIKSGLDPESEAVKKLKIELDNANGSIKEHEQSVKNAEQALIKKEKAAVFLRQALSYLASHALKAVIEKTWESVKATAAAGDEYAKTARIVGTTAEAYQELEYAAKQSGLSGDQLKGSLQKLNKSMADLKGGSGTLHGYLKDTNKALLDSLKSCNSNEQAFSTLMEAIRTAPNEFERAALAQAAFGKSGQELIIFAENGANGISALREEARKYGIISNEAAEQSEKFMDAQTRLKAAFQGVGYEIAEHLTPTVTGIIQKAADFIAGIDDWAGKLKHLTVAVVSATAAIGAFKAAMKIGPSLQAATAAIKATGISLDVLKVKIHAVNAAIKANPIGLAATLIAAGVGVIAGALTNAIAKQIEYSNTLDNNTDAANRNARAHASLALLTSKSLKFEGREMYNDVNALLEARIRNLNLLENIQAEARKREAAGWAAGAQAQRNAANGYINFINDIENRLRALAVMQGQVFDPNSNSFKPASSGTKTGEDEKSLQQRLSAIQLTEAQSQNERINQIQSFLKQRADLEGAASYARIETLQKELKNIKDKKILSNDELIAAEAAANQAILETRHKMADESAKLAEKITAENIARVEALNAAEGERVRKEKERADAIIEIKRKEVEAFAGFFGAMSGMLDSFGNESREMAIAVKTFAAVQAGINSYLAFTQALRDETVPSTIARNIQAAAVLASGIAAQTSIWRTGIPSAETGGRFVVPDVSPRRVDNVGMMVNPGERVTVEPRGMAGDAEMMALTVNLIVDSQVLASAHNRNVRAGRIINAHIGANL